MHFYYESSMIFFFKNGSKYLFQQKRVCNMYQSLEKNNGVEDTTQDKFVKALKFENARTIMEQTSNNIQIAISNVISTKSLKHSSLPFPTIIIKHYP